jgi:hypothetical protein
MKIFITIIAAAISISCISLQAQNNLPKGFSKGSITLPGNTVINGYVKDNLRSKGSLEMMAAESQQRKNYNASELLGAQIDSSRFICIKGDFFRIISAGELYFLQKASNGSNEPVYNGTEAIFVKGNDGQVNDYFFYDSASQQLKLLTKKNRNEMIAGTFTNCAAAIAKASQTGTDLAQLQQAVDIYNQRGQK